MLLTRGERCALCLLVLRGEAKWTKARAQGTSVQCGLGAGVAKSRLGHMEGTLGATVGPRQQRLEKLSAQLSFQLFPKTASLKALSLRTSLSLWAQPRRLVPLV